MDAALPEYQTARNIRIAAMALGLLVLTFATAISWLSWVHERARQQKSMEALAELGSESLDGYFLGLQGAMRLMSGEILGPDDGLDMDRARAALARFKAAFPELRITTLAGLDGTILLSTDAPAVGRQSASMAAQRTFIQARDERIRTGNRNLTIGRAFLGPISNAWVVPLGYGVWTSEGQLAYILGAGLPVAKPESFWKDAPLPEGAALGLRRDDGYLLVRYPNPEGARPEEVYATPARGPLGEYLQKNGYPARGTTIGVSRLAQVETQFVFRRLTNFPLTFFVANRTANIVHGWWTRVWDVYLLLLVLVLCGYYVYRWALRRQIQFEAERGRQFGMLQAANQELEDFAYTIAHDLKSPVRAIDANAGMAQELLGPGIPDPVRHRLAQIRRNATRMGELIDDLLEFSRYSHAPLSRQTVDMNLLARTVAAEQVPADAGIELEISPLPPCEADPGLMRVVWTALLSNAVKYSRTVEAPIIRVGYADGAYFVSDNGVGFDMAHAGKLFGVFSRLHGAEEFEGTGAGLAIAHRILQRHEGSIDAIGQPGLGATFRFFVGPPAAAAGDKG